MLTSSAFELGKLALHHDIKSYICWHVYGLLYRSVKNYEESIKAYRFALRLEPDSAQILRDLAFLQAQMRDYEGYIQSRNSMLQSKPFQRANWTSLAVAYHLNGQLEAAEKTLKTYEDTLKQPPPHSDVEHSECAMYRNSIIEELGEYERALEHLEAVGQANLDRTAVMETRARLQLKLGKLADAEKAYRVLLERNNEYRLYYEGLEKALGLDRSKKEDVPKLRELYETFATKERSDAPARIPLDFLTGEDFKKAADVYMTRMLTKGVPSTFTNVKSLYTDESKRNTLVELVEGYLEKPAPEANGSAKPSRLKESSLYFLAQHYDYYVTRDIVKAQEYIDKALEMDPKSVVYTQTKGRVLKHLGNTAEAAKIMEKARKLDEKDRYINSKSSKYLLRNNQNDEAIKIMSKFTRNEAVGGAFGDLLDMQCMWFLYEDGEAYLRKGMLSLALKRYKAIYDIFDVWQEDQFDFHHYSMRKGAARAYMDMVRWMDRLREHPFFTRAAVKAVGIYVHLADSGPQSNGDAHNIPGWEKMDEAQRNLALKKAKKAREKEEREKKAEAEKAGVKDGQKSSKKDAEAASRKEDQDPKGLKLVATKTPLEDAMPYVAYLLEFSPKSLEGQLASFDVFIRRSEFIQQNFKEDILTKEQRSI
jgi:tetratricopeptide (TPR) repeat protein